MNQILNHFGPGETFSTKELATILNVSTKEAYKICSDLEKDGNLYKYGYRIQNKGMVTWESPEHSTLKPNSLHWQVCQL